MSLKEDLTRKVEIYKPDEEVEQDNEVLVGEIVELGQKDANTLQKSKVKNLEETAQLETLTIQSQARGILEKNISGFATALKSAEPKDFASMMKMLSDISGVTKPKGDRDITIPIQVKIEF